MHETGLWPSYTREKPNNSNEPSANLTTVSARPEYYIYIYIYIYIKTHNIPSYLEALADPFSHLGLENPAKIRKSGAHNPACRD